MKEQLAIDFTPGLLERFESVTGVVRAVHASYGDKRAKEVAADLDMSPSELARRVADDPKDLPFRLRDLEAWIDASGDTTVVKYLALKYLSNPDAASERAMRDLAALAPTFVALAKAAGIASSPVAKARR